MARTTEKIITVVCKKCLNAFPVKVKIKTGSEETERTEIDTHCPFCNTLLTVEIEGKLRMNQISLRKYEGKPKNNEL